MSSPFLQATWAFLTFLIAFILRLHISHNYRKPAKNGGFAKTFPECGLYSDEELGVELFRAGISNKNINDILVALQQAERLCSWYWSDQSGRYPTEFEIISHIIVPLLLGLGWSHQQIAVEWNRIDVALFNPGSGFRTKK